MPQAVVGLGNPGAEYRETRHNIGHRVLELLAQRFHKRWTREAQSMVARGQWRGETLYLLKPLAFMNVTGPVMAASLRRLALDPTDCVLVYDDIDLPLGRVRVRLRGSHGGHNGVRSVIEALHTEELRRVKVGIGRPSSKHQVPDHVLAGFLPEELPVIEAACAEAADRALELVGSRYR